MTQDDVRCPQCGYCCLRDQHCKYLCTKCGYAESCEDVCLTVPWPHPHSDGEDQDAKHRIHGDD